MIAGPIFSILIKQMPIKSRNKLGNEIIARFNPKHYRDENLEIPLGSVSSEQSF